MSTKTHTASMVSLVAASLSCLAEPSAAATVKYTFNGSSAGAQFVSYEGCVETSTYISAYDNVENKLASSFLTFYTVKIDACTFTYLGGLNATANLADTNFVVGGAAKNATLVARIEAIDSVSGASKQLDINLSWSATELDSRGVNHVTYVYPDYRSIETSKGVGRRATAVGTISDGQTNYTPDPSFSAGINDSSAGSIAITKRF